MKARVYTETVLHVSAEPFEQDRPFQIAIVEFKDGARKTVRIRGERVKIGDDVEVDGEQARLASGKGQ